MINLFTSTDLLVDIWAFDASITKPLYRRRLQTIRNGAMQGRSILGAQNRTLWVLLPTGLHAVNLETGDIVARPERLVDINPNLQGLLPVEARYFSFTPDGVAIRAADARVWYIHPDTLRASEAPPVGAWTTIFPAYFTPQASYAFLERGFPLGRKWLGLLNPEEAAIFGRKNAVGDLDYQSRRALYSADIAQQRTFFGPQPRYYNFQRLTEEFLAPGILAEHRPTGSNALVYRRDAFRKRNVGLGKLDNRSGPLSRSKRYGEPSRGGSGRIGGTTYCPSGDFRARPARTAAATSYR
ncbi:MAG TPA: PA2928 family protein [Bryobacteraceae bacterium]|jgi:hypothetical protein|nr:PA2928 family protein [Bryobacteraceae bacterium]